MTITLISRSADSMNLQVLLGDPRQPITTSLSPGQQWVHTYDMAQKAGFSKLQVTDLGSGRTLVSEDITFNWPEQVSRTFYVERPSSAGSTDPPVSADTTESPAGQSAAGKDSRVTVTVISRSQAVMNLEMYLWPGRPDVYGGREAPFKVPLAPGEKWVHTYNVGPMSAMSFFSVADLDSEKRILEERIVWTQAGQQLERTLYVGGGDERK